MIDAINEIDYVVEIGCEDDCLNILVHITYIYHPPIMKVDYPIDSACPGEREYVEIISMKTIDNSIFNKGIELINIVEQNIKAFTACVLQSANAIDDGIFCIRVDPGCSDRRFEVCSCVYVRRARGVRATWEQVHLHSPHGLALLFGE